MYEWCYIVLVHRTTMYNCMYNPAYVQGAMYLYISLSLNYIMTVQSTSSSAAYAAAR